MKKLMKRVLGRVFKRQTKSVTLRIAFKGKCTGESREVKKKRFRAKGKGKDRKPYKLTPKRHE